MIRFGSTEEIAILQALRKSPLSVGQGFLDAVKLEDPYLDDKQINFELAKCIEDGLVSLENDKYTLTDAGEKELAEIEAITDDILNFVTDADMDSLVIEPQKWLVKDLVPENSIVFCAGKRGVFKSFASIHIGLCIASGKPVFNMFETQKSRVLYIDEENGIQTLKERRTMLKKGLDLNGNVELFFTSLENIKLDRVEWQNKLRKFITEYNPRVIIIDSFRRTIGIDENDAGQVSRIFTDIIKKLSKEFGVTWVLLHHLRKGISGRNPTDEMDELRGSSDFSNYADVVLVMNRPKGSNDRFILKQVKCRRAVEIPPKVIQLTWNNGSLKMECIGDAEETLLADEMVAKAIMSWLAENQIGNFRTRDVEDGLKGQAIAKATLHRGLDLLINQGRIARIKRGQYSVSTQSLENFIEKPEIKEIPDKEDFEDAERGYKEVSAYEGQCEWGYHNTLVEYKIKDDIDHKWKPACASCFHDYEAKKSEKR